ASGGNVHVSDFYITHDSIYENGFTGILVNILNTDSTPQPTPMVSGLHIEDNYIHRNALDGVHIRYHDSLNLGEYEGIELRRNSIDENDSLGIFFRHLPIASASAHPVVDVMGGTDWITTTSIYCAFSGGVPGDSILTEYFFVPTPDASGAGEGRVFCGSDTWTLDLTGSITFFTDIDTLLSQGDMVTATATSLTTRNTSEFGMAGMIGPMGVHEAKAERLEVYPSLAATKVRVEAGFVIREVMVFDLSGKKVWESAPLYGEQSVEFDVTKWSTGKYLIQAKGDEVRGVGRFLRVE
ncbi:MAG: hypothetical protein AAF570_26130, partial [Bacteroidota bacterium]